jgi:hypothetical protein
MKLKPILLFLLVAHLLAEASFGQSAGRYEVSAGYSFLAGDLEKDRHGFVTSFTHRVSGRFGIETEVGGNYRKEPFLTQNDYVHSILAGPKFKFRKDAKLVPWAHALAGITIDDRTFPLTIATPIGPSTIGVSTTFIKFAFQPGGGIDYWLTGSFGVRVGADYRSVAFSNRDFFRAQSGVVFRFGGN